MKHKNKGFTLIEVLAVVSLLAILITVATVSILRYRKDVNEKEKTTLRSTIKSSFDTYRIQGNVLKGSKVSLNTLKFDNKLSFNGKKCSSSDLEQSYIFYRIKGDYGECMQDTTVEEDDAIVSCKLDENGNEIPSKEEEYCLYLICHNEEVINDKSDENSVCSK